tara:strand:- start:501 stop:1040 length:540 start_codon:yes stop_codon:yes gene_type:complete
MQSEIVFHDDQKVIVKSTIFDDGEIISTGHAEEVRSSSKINSTSALENAETSSLGRALSFFKYAGSEIASADEVANAISQQKDKEVVSEWKDYMDKVREHGDSLNAVTKWLLESENPDADRERCLLVARECFNEIPDADKIKLWKAPSKGGFFRTHERKLLSEAGEIFSRKRKEVDDGK